MNSKLNTKDPARGFNIDLALAVMCALQVEGQSVSGEVIAEVTGLSKFGAYAIEQRALDKLRKKLAPRIYEEMH